MKIILCILSFVFLFSCKTKNNKEQDSKQTSNVIGCAVPAITDTAWYSSGKKAPLLNGLDGINFTISTKNKDAQRYFNQAMMLAYGFNHAEAARSFYEVTRLDSNCAMGYWGFAYVLGPNYNAGMEPDHYKRAYEATQKALSLTNNISAKEKRLIEALNKRYTPEAPVDRSSLDQAYAEEMKKIYNQFPTDPDIGAIYAESLMNLHPWNLYDKNTKETKPWTPEIVKLLEEQVKTNPKHAGLHHFYIHALETSATPEKALESSRILETMVPGSGHLLHMPSHIYINTGDYHAGSVSNLKAITSDSSYTTACHAQGAYPLAYFPHNYHFLAATATLGGESGLAWEAAKKMYSHSSKDIMKMPGWGTIQHYYTIPYYVGVKLSHWDSILSMPEPEKEFIYPRAVWHYARGMAYLGKNNLSKANEEWNALEILSKDSVLKEITIWNINTTADLVAIANKVLKGEIEAKQNNWDESVRLLNEAIVIEDNLNYNEPPDWFFSVRHELGAAYLKSGKFREAENTYRKDLLTWKKNGWALIGLYHALINQKKNKEAELIKSEFNKAWQYADITINSSSPLL